MLSDINNAIVINENESKILNFCVLEAAFLSLKFLEMDVVSPYDLASASLSMTL